MPYPITSKSSRFLFDWRAADGLDLQGRLVARTGQIATFDRGGTAGSATSLDVNGRVFTPGYKRPRFYHDPNNLSLGQLLSLEGQRINRAQYSEKLNTAPWTHAACTVTEGYLTVAGLSFSRLSGLSPGASYCRQQITLVGDGTKVICGFFKSDGNAGNFDLMLYDTSVPATRGRIVVTVASDGSMTATATAGVKVFCTQLGTTGVYCVAIQASSVVAANANFAYVCSDLASVTVTSILAAGIQPEDSAVPSSYIPTPGAATITRSPDSCIFACNAVVGAMTWYTKFVERGTAQVTNARIAQLGTSPRVILYAPAGKYGVLHDNGSSSVTSTSAAAPAYGDVVELFVSLMSTGAVNLTQVLNGGSEAVAGPSAALLFGSAWTGGVLGLGNDASGTNQGFAGFQSFRIASGVQVPGYMRQG